MTAKFRHRLFAICRLRNQNHVRLRGKNRAQPLAKDRMVLDAQDANKLAIHGHGRSTWLAVSVNCRRCGSWTRLQIRVTSLLLASGLLLWKNRIELTVTMEEVAMRNRLVAAGILSLLFACTAFAQNVKITK